MKMADQLDPNSGADPTRIAEEAARRCGMSLGEWLNAAIFNAASSGVGAPTPAAAGRCEGSQPVPPTLAHLDERLSQLAARIELILPGVAAGPAETTDVSRQRGGSVPTATGMSCGEATAPVAKAGDQPGLGRLAPLGASPDHAAHLPDGAAAGPPNPMEGAAVTLRGGARPAHAGATELTLSLDCSVVALLLRALNAAANPASEAVRGPDHPAVGDGVYGHSTGSAQPEAQQEIRGRVAQPDNLGQSADNHGATPVRPCSSVSSRHDRVDAVTGPGRRPVELVASPPTSLPDTGVQGDRGSIDVSALKAIERGLAEVRYALKGLAPGENLSDVDDRLNELARKLDLLVSSRSNLRSRPDVRPLESELAVSRPATARNGAEPGGDISAIGTNIYRRLTNEAEGGQRQGKLGAAERIAAGSNGTASSIDVSTRGAASRPATSNQQEDPNAEDLQDRIVRLTRKIDGADNKPDSLQQEIGDLLATLREFGNCIADVPQLRRERAGRR